METVQYTIMGKKVQVAKIHRRDELFDGIVMPYERPVEV